MLGEACGSTLMQPGNHRESADTLRMKNQNLTQQSQLIRYNRLAHMHAGQRRTLRVSFTS